MYLSLGALAMLTRMIEVVERKHFLSILELNKDLANLEKHKEDIHQNKGGQLQVHRLRRYVEAKMPKAKDIPNSIDARNL